MPHRGNMQGSCTGMRNVSPLERLDQAVRYYVRYMIQIPSLYLPDGSPHVFLFSTRRSGSTLVRDMIASTPGFNYIDQPFDSTQYNPYLPRLKPYSLSQITSASETEFSEIKAYLDSLLQRRAILRSQWQFWSRGYSWIWHRYVVKIHSAKAIIGRFDTSYGPRVRTAYLVRHPIPTALSMAKRGWLPTSAAYLQDEHYRDRYLTGSIIDRARSILLSGSETQKLALDWFLENLVPLTTWQESEWLTLSYERLITQPGEAARRILTNLNIDHSHSRRMVSIIDRPTRTTTRGSAQKIRMMGPESRLDSWLHRVDSSFIRFIGELLDLFEIDLYKADHAYAREQFDSPDVQ